MNYSPVWCVVKVYDNETAFGIDIRGEKNNTFNQCHLQVDTRLKQQNDKPSERF